MVCIRLAGIRSLGPAAARLAAGHPSSLDGSSRPRSRSSTIPNSPSSAIAAAPSTGSSAVPCSSTNRVNSPRSISIRTRVMGCSGVTPGRVRAAGDNAAGCAPCVHRQSGFGRLHRRWHRRDNTRTGRSVAGLPSAVGSRGFQSEPPMSSKKAAKSSATPMEPVNQPWITPACLHRLTPTDTNQRPRSGSPDGGRHVADSARCRRACAGRMPHPAIGNVGLPDDQTAFRGGRLDRRRVVSIPADRCESAATRRCPRLSLPACVRLPSMLGLAGVF
jgi:hypothetical protein